jgi:hypothetical protein
MLDEGKLFCEAAFPSSELDSMVEEICGPESELIKRRLSIQKPVNL